MSGIFKEICENLCELVLFQSYYVKWIFSKLKYAFWWGSFVT